MANNVTEVFRVAVPSVGLVLKARADIDGKQDAFVRRVKEDAETVRELNPAGPVEGVNEGVNKGVNGGVKILLAAIRKNPGKRTNELAVLIGKSVQTVERYVKELKAAGDVEFRGAPKNGGYFIIDNEGR